MKRSLKSWGIIKILLYLPSYIILTRYLICQRYFTAATHLLSSRAILLEPSSNPSPSTKVTKSRKPIDLQWDNKNRTRLGSGYVRYYPIYYPEKLRLAAEGERPCTSAPARARPPGFDGYYGFSYCTHACLHRISIADVFSVIIPIESLRQMPCHSSGQYSNCYYIFFFS